MAHGADTLILDIDSASVGVCVVTDGDKPTMSQVKRVPVGTGEVKDPAGLIPLLKESLTALLADYAKVNPKKVSIVLAGPWFTASLRTLSSKSEKPVRVSPASIKHVVAENKKTGASGTPIESVPITVSVNGYHTLVRSNVTGTTLAVTLYESFADQQLLTIVTDAVHAIAPHAHIDWHTSPLVYTETILRITGDEFASIVDVGGELTDVVIASRRTIGFVGSIPDGARSIARAVATGGPLADAESRLQMFARGELKDADMQALSASLTTAGATWQKGYADITAEAGNVVPIPHNIYIVGERDELPWFARIVGGTLTTALQPIVVTPEFFNGAIAFGEGGAYDASLALAVLFFHMRVGVHSSKSTETAVLYSIQ